MSQSLTTGLAFSGRVAIGDSPNLDSFSRLRVSNPVGQLDSQFTYDLQPLIFEQKTNGSGAAIAHDATNRMALMTFASTPTGGYAYMQTYEWFRYQAGRAQLPIITFNFNGGVANVIKFAEYGDGNNAYGFRMNGTTPQFYILSDTTNGDQVINLSSANIDKLDGTGPSGVTFDPTKEQILVVDFQALYVGRVRMGLDIGGQIVLCHEFLHANTVAYPYIQNASLPVHVGMTCTGTVSTTMWFNCATVLSEGGADEVAGYAHSAEGTGTAGNATDVHILSVRPKTTFNSIANRSKFTLESIEILVTGNEPVAWKLVIGQAISGTTTFNDVNTNYSAFEYNTVGTISGSPALVVARGYIAASNQTKSVTSAKFANKYPISLDAAGAVRALGTISIIAQGVAATSAMRASMNWREIR